MLPVPLSGTSLLSPGCVLPERRVLPSVGRLPVRADAQPPTHVRQPAKALVSPTQVTPGTARHDIITCFHVYMVLTTC
eukprot:30837-Eustigmatos_ZCMA.PRE.1